LALLADEISGAWAPKSSFREFLRFVLKKQNNVNFLKKTNHFIPHFSTKKETKSKKNQKKQKKTTFVFIIKKTKKEKAPAARNMCDFRAAVSLVTEKRGTQLSNREMLAKVSAMMSVAGNAQASVCVGRAYDLCSDDKEPVAFGHALDFFNVDHMSRFACIVLVEGLLRQEDGIVVLSPRREHDRRMFRMASEQKYTDMTIEVMEHLTPSDTTRTFGANKAVLYQTPYFAAMIDAEKTNTECDGVYRIKMMDPRVFAFLLEYIYTGAIEPEGSAIAPDMLASIAVAADMLRLPLLVAACADFVCPRNALFVLKAAARVGTPEMGMLIERCASAIVLGTSNASAEWDLDPLAFVALPLHAVYAIVTQAVLAIHRFSPEETSMIGRAWAALQARFDGASLCDLQYSLQDDELRCDADENPAMLLGPYSKTFTFDRDRASAEHHVQFEATMGGQHVTAIVHNTKNCADAFACVDIEVRLIPPTVAVDQSNLSSSPRLIVVRTEVSCAKTGVSTCGFTDDSIGIFELQEELDDPSKLRFTVELDPLFDFLTAVAVCTLQHDTEEIVKGFELNVLCWVLRSPKTVYDPIRVLRAVASRDVRDSGSDRAAIVAVLIPRLSDVPVSRLLDLLHQAPSLSRIGDFTKLLWSRTVATTSADTLVQTLEAHMHLICAARETALVQEIRVKKASKTGPGGPDDAAGLPKTKIARLV
jgi:hypothetical protein